MESTERQSGRWSLALMALGVVFGDIGTSPLYAFRECLKHAGYDPARDGVEMVYGPISLIFWSLTLVVSIKYLTLLSRATAQGEGGIFALLSLLQSKKTMNPRQLGLVIPVVLFGASLLYSDGMITPAISVLAAVEGLTHFSDQISQQVVAYVSVVILLGLFLAQGLGTARIGGAFGPIMIAWFGALAALGIYRFCEHPQVIAALSPHWGVSYLTHHGFHGVVIMGTVLLAVTGCEALYADIGHFGAPPLRRAWAFVVYPSLVFNYLGQGAMVIADAAALKNPFFELVPEALLIPMIALATAATIIASQALITGIFSLTQQAVHLGYLPRLRIVHTNPDVRGQIYMPQVNFILMTACIALVLGFRSSGKLASAYGLAVSMDMMLTSVLLFLVARLLWKWPAKKAVPVVAAFLVIELGYVSGSLSKFLHGAWFPLVMASCIYLIMRTWIDGRKVLFQSLARGHLDVGHLVSELREERIPRVKGTGVFMSASADGLPFSLLHHLKHNKSLHQQVILLTVRFADQPFVAVESRHEITEYSEGLFRVVLNYGFSESPSVFQDLCAALKSRDAKVKPGAMSFYQSREVLLATGRGKMAKWRKQLFVTISRLSRPATGYFDLPPRQVIELGIQIEM